MKVLLKKIKRSNKTLLGIYILSVLLFLFGFIAFTYSICRLTGIETFIRILVTILLFSWFLAYFLFGLSTLVTNKIKKFLILTIAHLLMFMVLLFITVVINHLYGKLELLTNQEYTTYTTNLVALKETELKSESKLGMISNSDDIEGYILANTLINKNHLENKIEYYDDYYSMLSALYNKEVDAVFVSSNYGILFSTEEVYEDIVEETQVLYEYSEKMKTKTITSTNKKLTEPFTILLMGVDSTKKGLDTNATFNGDTLMLISFNPQTLNATMLSLPRDLYVPIACNNNRSHKINSSAAYGTECVINTVQNLVDIKIDYYAKINFHGVMDLVDAIGGIDIDVEEPNYQVYVRKYGEGRLCESNYVRDDTHPVCMNTGWQHLDGEQTLAYARNRHGYLESDLARNRHQQQIVEAIAKKMISLKSFSDFENVLNAIANNIATNVSTTNILSFYQTLKTMLMQSLKGNDFLSIQKTYLEVYNLPVTIGGLQLAALGYYENSLNKIKEAFNVNLGLQKEEMIKTFSYDYNEEYTSPIIGKGITGGIKEETIPNFVGSTVKYAEEWTSSHNIALTKEYRCSDKIPGIIGGQNVSAGTFASSVSSITVYINEVCDNNPKPEEENQETTTPNQTPEQPETNESTTPNVTDPNLGGPENETPKEDNTEDNKENTEDNKEETPEEPVVPGLPTEDEDNA